MNRYQKYYQPTDEYLRTTGGQAFSSELARLRQNALDRLKEGCSESAIREGLKAVRKTGLFVTDTPQEISTVREIEDRLDCCLFWHPEIRYREEQAFKSEYEEGVLIQEAHFSLQTNRRDDKEALWAGEWIFRFKGREGTAEGVSPAKLRYRRGEETASLTIGTSRVTSVGRINMPIPLSGDFRTVEVQGNPIRPEAVFSEKQAVPLMGCREIRNA